MTQKRPTLTPRGWTAGVVAQHAKATVVIWISVTSMFFRRELALFNRGKECRVE